jgi:predicted pyridoxine 5'-phosphate oxidase superfamily flavin-nucleotide-binding protein
MLNKMPFQERIMNDYISDIAFTSSVKGEQEKHGSRKGYQKMAEKRDWQNTVTDDLKSFIAERDSIYIATSNREGQPYIQHRGGPKGFLKILDERTLAFADYSGNKQYISMGNLADNDKAYIFLMDYPNHQRIKIWGSAKVVEDDAELLARMMPDGYRARPERVFVFTITAWDANCPQHIMPRYDEDMVRRLTEKLTVRVGELEAENARLKEQLELTKG